VGGSVQMTAQYSPQFDAGPLSLRSRNASRLTPASLDSIWVQERCGDPATPNIQPSTPSMVRSDGVRTGFGNPALAVMVCA
jgi:hypothetical protein